MKQKDKFDYYVQQRTIAKALWSKIFQSAEREHLVSAAKCIDLWEEPNQLLVESDFEFDLFAEFYLFNYKIDGKSPVERYALNHSPDNDLERTVLESGVHSKASLYLVDSVDPRKRTVNIIDLLDLDEEYAFMDFTMSQQSKIKKHLLFTRILLLPHMNMLTGATMPFPPEFTQVYPKFYNELSRQLKTTDKETRQFQVFWELYQEYGIPMSNVDFS